MGYQTEFTGCFNLNKKLSTKMHGFLNSFNEIRHVKRHITHYGLHGEFYVNQDESGIRNPNDDPPSTQPNEWCQWRPTHDGMGIEWDGNEKFYDYVTWLKYIIAKFLKPNGYILNGTVQYQGEDSDDNGNIRVVRNRVVNPKYVSGYQGRSGFKIKGSVFLEGDMSESSATAQPDAPATVPPPEPEDMYTIIPKRRILMEDLE